MKKVLGLDLGVTSIGWALVNEAENEREKSSIIRLGVRVNPLTADEQKNFEEGKSISPNAERTKKRSARRNLQRYKLRREALTEILKENKIITDEAILSENGNHTTFQTYQNRANAATKKLNSLEDFARILLMLNKKRGYKSSRKVKSQDEGQLIDGIEIAKKLYEEKLTPGKFVLKEILNNGKKFIPDFYRSDLQNEFDKIWNFQKQFYPEILTDKNKEKLAGLGKEKTRDYFQKELNIELATYKPRNKRDYWNEIKLYAYQLRTNALEKKISINELAFVLTEINNQFKSSSGYLGAISDRSKELYFNKQTIGQNLWQQIKSNPHTRLKGQVFYRQDYLDEFEILWNEQAKHFKELTPELKEEIRDVIIFFQRKLKSQKGLISFCEFERKEIEVEIDGKKKTKLRGLRVCPKSSPLFQEFKIWQNLNNLEFENKKTKKKFLLTDEEIFSLENINLLFEELNIKGNLKKAEMLELLFENPKEWDMNFKEVQGNITNKALYEAYQKIIEVSGHGEHDFKTMRATEIKKLVSEVLKTLNIKTEILEFDALLDNSEKAKKFENQPHYQLWHLLYSYEDDNSPTGKEKLFQLLKNKFGFEKEHAQLITNTTFQPDYCSLSAKAIRKILPYLKEGNRYDVACVYAGYNHSHSLNTEQKENKIYKDKLNNLPKNSLRNPVVEKILNQMVNVVNAICDEYSEKDREGKITKYFKPDEIRIELARELKKSADERKELSDGMTKAKEEHDEYRGILKKEFALPYISRKDIIRYKLYKELESNGYKTLYSNTYVQKEQLFSKEFDVDHIIPQAKLFDDSFSNKTLELKSLNIEKADRTAYDFVFEKYGDDGLHQFVSRVEQLNGTRNKKETESGEEDRKNKSPKISKTKYKKLLMKGSEIPGGFIVRDIRNTQYIAKKAKTMLEEVFKDVNTTTGSITDRLREDWQLVHLMQELNWNIYDALGMTEKITTKDGNVIKQIKDWTKRNDHRHHAMDALTVAFTKKSYVQYLNNRNARSDKSSSIYGIEQKELYRDEKNKLRFKPPIPLDDFRAEAKKQLEKILISIKAKNKVATKNKNKFKVKDGYKTKTELTPRGQLHLETVYGSKKYYKTKIVKVGSSLDLETINKVAKQKYRNALLKRLSEFNNNPKKAFTGSNSLSKKPIYLNELQTEKIPKKIKLVYIEQKFGYRPKEGLTPDFFKDSKGNDDFYNRVDDVYDGAVKKALKKHYEKIKIEVEEFNKTVTKEKEKKKVLETAFSNLEDNPVWLNKEKGIKIKSVTTKGISTGEPLHYKKDKEGKIILDGSGHKIPVDYVSTSGNHHAAIYIDADGNLHDNVVSFYEAVARVNAKPTPLPIIDKNYNSDNDWKFLFSMKQNEYFVFPNEKTGFNPKEIDLLNPENYSLISPNLFRLQKMSKTSTDYVFRHHLETVVQRKNADGKSADEKPLRDIIYKQLKSLPELKNIVKVRVNHIGKIVSVGEY